MVIGHARQQGVLNELREINGNHKKTNRFTKTKYLGLNVDQCKKYKYQAVKTKVKGGRSAIRKLKNFLSQSKLAADYRASIESHRIYGNILWGGGGFLIPSSTLFKDYSQEQGMYVSMYVCV